MNHADGGATTKPWEFVSFGIVGLALLLVLSLHLLAALFAGLLVFELIHVLVPVFRLERMAGKWAKALAVGLLAAAIVGLLTVGIFWAISFIRGGALNLPLLVQLVAEALEGTRGWLPAPLEQHLPADIEELRQAVAHWLREHGEELRNVGQETLRTLAHMLMGMIIGAMLSLRGALALRDNSRPLGAALSERTQRLADAFRRVVFAQARISALNTVFTWAYLMLFLPLAGVHLPYGKTLVAVTFIAGLLPVLGNLISNTLIVVVSLNWSIQLAVVSLGFLVVIHKLEYFLNAHIIGSRIRAHAWELLLAMLIMEAAFGFRGLIAAPVFYAYLKDELQSKQLV